MIFLPFQSYFLHSTAKFLLSQQWTLVFLQHLSISSHLLWKLFPPSEHISISAWAAPFFPSYSPRPSFELFFNLPRAVLHVFFSALLEDTTDCFNIGLILLLSMRQNTPWSRALPFPSCIQKWYRGTGQLRYWPHASFICTRPSDWVQPSCTTSTSGYNWTIYHLLKQARDSIDERISLNGGWNLTVVLIKFMECLLKPSLTKGAFSNFEILSLHTSVITAETSQIKFECLWRILF